MMERLIRTPHASLLIFGHEERIEDPVLPGEQTDAG